MIMATPIVVMIKYAFWFRMFMMFLKERKFGERMANTAMIRIRISHIMLLLIKLLIFEFSIFSLLTLFD